LRSASANSATRTGSTTRGRTLLRDVRSGWACSFWCRLAHRTRR
jgi:hypothetical protein